MMAGQARAVPEAGDALDAAVAQALDCRPCDRFRPLSDIADAMAVVDRYRAAGHGVSLCWSNVSDRWTCIISGSCRAPDGGYVVRSAGVADDKALAVAICRAALAAGRP